MNGAEISQHGGVAKVPETDLTHPHQTDKQAEGEVQLSSHRENHNNSGLPAHGCQTDFLGRLKHSCMFWTVGVANAIITLRCCQPSRKFEDDWEARRA